MKKYIKLFILGLLSTLTLNAQNTVRREIAIEPDAMNVFYAGLHNPLEIAYSGATNDQLAIESDLGTLSKDTSGEYSIFIPYDQAGELVNISVYLNKEKEAKKYIGTRQFRLLPVPEPNPYFGSKTGGEISRGELHLINFVSVRLYDFAFDGLKFTVHKFTFTYIPKLGKVSKFISNDAALTPEMIDLLDNSKDGDKIIISDIWASFPEGGIVKLSMNIELTVK
jgi:hypothetical protein